MQTEKEIRPRCREKWPIEIIEGAQKTLDRHIVQMDPYFRESGQSFCTRMKSYLTKFNSEQEHIREGSEFYKH